MSTVPYRRIVKLCDNRWTHFSPGCPRPWMMDATEYKRAATQADSRSCRLTVLVVEDNTDCALTTGSLLRHLGYRVRLAKSGESALVKVVATPPDVVLLDIGLPGMDGYRTAQLLKDKCPKRPFVI